MTDHNLSNEELQEKMDAKARELMKGDGLGSLFIHNLENFAYRYLETSRDSDIKCKINSQDFTVTSIEPNILEALKWENKDLKKKLISLCKEHPGKASQNIQLKLVLGSKVLADDKVECYSNISWSIDDFNSVNTISSASTTITYDDILTLRNTHAKYLEEVAVIF